LLGLLEVEVPELDVVVEVLLDLLLLSLEVVLRGVQVWGVEF